ncbi:Uncharacterized protein HA466_0188580 [Hirschfeldia incana]|nr:Uncharacterized protein HA466_0188580 [Hirschfeldia incana]
MLDTTVFDLHPHFIFQTKHVDKLLQQQQKRFSFTNKKMARSRSLLLILLFISISLSTARILPGEFLPVNLSGEISPDSKEVVGCGDEGSVTKTGYSFMPEVVAGKFGSLVLNALPKGSRPASGPSRKSNDVKT